MGVDYASTPWKTDTFLGPPHAPFLAYKFSLTSVVLLQVITVLNHAGVCVSYTTAWKYLRQLTAESRYLDIVREEQWIWAYDNLNFNIRVRHEREGTSNCC